MAVPDRPLIFAKFPSSLTGPDTAVEWSAELTEQVDWEVELAVVVGRRTRNAEPDEALDALFGYTRRERPERARPPVRGRRSGCAARASTASARSAP